jgi:hypothetical protein
MHAYKDILIFLTTLEEHLKHIHLVLQRLREVGLKLKPSKCHFVRKQVEYLGHILTPDGLKPNPTLVQAVRVSGAYVSNKTKEISRTSLLLSEIYPQVRQYCTAVTSADVQRSYF